MPSSAAIRLQVETTLANRVPAALTLKIKQAPATRIAEVDTVLDGGIPRGGITEVAGAASTGKTSFVYRPSPPLHNPVLPVPGSMSAIRSRPSRRRRVWS